VGFIIRYVKLNIRKIIIPTFTETRTQDSFGVCDLSSSNLLAETNNFGTDAILISCLVSELQEPPSPGLELWTVFRSFDPPVFSSLSQGIIMPSLVKIGASFLELEVNINTNISTISTLYLRFTCDTGCRSEGR
jgi:hypothetical protein